jgi:molybdate transport system substrate-binding protein
VVQASNVTRTALLALAIVAALGGAGLQRGSGLAQGAAIECPEPAAAPAASPATGVASDSPMAGEVAAAFPAGGGELTVFAAASLTDAFAQVKRDLEAANPDLAIAYNFAGSQVLVTQLAEGADADVFASANAAQMQAATANGSIAGEPVIFVRNRLAIVTPADNPAGIDSPDDLASPNLKLILAQEEVPAGRYAREAVCLMGQDTARYGDGFVQRVAANIVSAEEDVRDVLTKVELGEADAGIVYVSDAAIAGDAVQLIEIPDAVNVVATYPIAVATGGDAALGEAFIAYLLSAEGQATLAAFGFEPVAG